jgi:dihydroorotase
MGLLLQNGQVLQGNDLVYRDVLIEGTRISLIEKDIPESNHTLVDCKGQFISPGFIDLHVHLREPGYEHKETIDTGTKAALKGGYTLICAMPNTNPSPDTMESLQHILDLIKKNAHTKVLPYARITQGDSTESPLVDMEQMADLVCGFSNDGFGIQSTKQMYYAMQKANQYESLIAAHCEDEELLFDGYVHKGLRSEQKGWNGMTSLTESLQIARDSLIAEETKARYHVCHISTKESVRIVKEAKKNGVDISAEVTPHHLLLTELEVQDTSFKMNPPLRGLDDKYALIKGLMDGTIDMIATDHAPHTEDEKGKGMKQAPFGIVGLETAFPLIYTHFVRSGLVHLKDLVKWFSYNPAKRLNMAYGKLVEGRTADITIIDLNTEKTIDKNQFVSKGKNTPFHGWKCYGWPSITIVDGVIKYKDGAFYE